MKVRIGKKKYKYSLALKSKDPDFAITLVGYVTEMVKHQILKDQK